MPVRSLISLSVQSLRALSLRSSVPSVGCFDFMAHRIAQYCRWIARKWKATATYAQTRQLAASTDLPIDSDSFRVGARHVATAAITAITAPMTAPSADNCSRRTNQRASDEITQNDALENISSTVTARAMNAKHSRSAVR